MVDHVTAGAPAHKVSTMFNTLRPRQNGYHFAYDILKCIFLNENVWFLIKISPKFVPKGLINNDPALVEIVAWRCPGNKPLSKPMMVSLPTHICVFRHQWVKAPKLIGIWLTTAVHKNIFLYFSYDDVCQSICLSICRQICIHSIIAQYWLQSFNFWHGNSC